MNGRTVKALLAVTMVSLILVCTEPLWYSRFMFLKVIEVTGLVFPIGRAIVAWTRNDPRKDW